jgi:small subunit ribosomal protein S1
MADPIENNVAAESAEGAGAAHEPAASNDAPAESSNASQDASSEGNGASEPQGASDLSAEGADDGDDAGAEGEGEHTAAGDDASPAGEGKKKRRRKRRRKGAGATANGEASPAGEGGGEQRPRKRDGAVAPLARFFSGANAGKRHGFAVGEVVAGRVKEIADGVITVDLFGKALAFVDEHEPREVPVAPMPEPEPETSPEAPAAAEAAPEAAATEAAAPVEGAEAAHVAAEASTPVDAEASEASSGEVSAAGEVEAHVHEDEHDEPEEHEEGHGGPRGPMTTLPVVPEELGRPEAPALGSVFRGRVGVTSESGHIALVNRLVDRGAIVAELEQARVNRRRVEGMVFGFNRGGFDVLVAGMRAFCPASAMSLMEIEDPNELVGKKLEFLLPAAQPVGSDIIVSRRSILERQQRKAAREMLKGLTPGQNFTGIVHSVREFGLIVDIGGIEGLVHQSELSWAHGVRPQDVAKPGDTVQVQVLRIGAEGGRDQGPQRRDRMTRVGLSIKALLPDPWDAHNDVLHEGGVQKGKVTRTTDFGAFIELAPEIEGLLHITELGRDLKHASAVVNEGDEIYVVVERVDRRARRIALSKLSSQEVADFEAGALEGGTKAVRPGSRITVKVERVEPRGLLVRVQGAVGRRARGYVPRTEMGEAGSGDMRKRFPQGSSLEVKVVGIDRDGGLRCSPKALQVDDERKAIKDYRREAAQQGFGTFGDLLRAKLGEAGPK